MGPSRRWVKTLDAGDCAQQARHGMERNLAGVRFAECGEHVYTMSICHRRNFTHQTAFADAGRADHADYGAVAITCTVQQAFNGGHFPLPTDQVRLRQWRPSCYQVISVDNVTEVEQRQQGGHARNLVHRIPAFLAI